MNEIICMVCGKLKQHHAKGLCANCYHQTDKWNNYFKIYHKSYRQTEKNKAYRKTYEHTPKRKTYGNIISFHENYRNELLKKVNNKCSKCSSDKELEIHHKKYVHGKEGLQYVVILCKKCHRAEHKK
jgi:hypothetical protein